MRLIDADVLIADCQLAQKQADGYGREFANAFYSGSGEISTEWWCVEDLIENAPTIEPERTGEWIDCDGGIATCSACGDRWGVYGVMKFCPNCGAKMQKPEDDIPMEYFESGGR